MEVLNTYERDYRKLLCHVLAGEIVSNRNHDTFVQVGCNIRANLQEGFPMLTGKKMFSKNAKHELKWMLNGDTNTGYLKENNVNIWDKWADDDGNLGPIYGKQMRDFNGVDQIEWVLEELKKPVRSRRSLVSLWNPNDLDKMKLPPCHYSFNFVPVNSTLSVQVTMRSLDLFVGLPYDMAFYALMLCLFCSELGMKPGEVSIMAADCHIYTDHKNPVLEYLQRPIHNLPNVTFPPGFGPLNFDPNYIIIENYKSEGFIKAKVHE